MRLWRPLRRIGSHPYCQPIGNLLESNLTVSVRAWRHAMKSLAAGAVLFLLAGCSYIGSLADWRPPEISVSPLCITERNVTIGERLATFDRCTTVTFCADGLTTRSVVSREFVQYRMTKDSVVGLSQVIAGATGSILTLMATKGTVE